MNIYSKSFGLKSAVRSALWFRKKGRDDFVSARFFPQYGFPVPNRGVFLERSGRELSFPKTRLFDLTLSLAPFFRRRENEPRETIATLVCETEALYGKYPAKSGANPTRYRIAEEHGQCFVHVQPAAGVHELKKSFS